MPERKSTRLARLKKEPDFKDKTDNMIVFLEEYVDNGGDAKAAWVKAGYSEKSTRSAMTYVRENMHLVSKLIHVKIGSHIPMAIQQIIDLMSDPKTPAAVKLKCAQDLLSRGGYDRPLEILTGERKPEELSNSELDKELTTLLARVNLEATTSKDQDKEIH